MCARFLFNIFVLYYSLVCLFYELVTYIIFHWCCNACGKVTAASGGGGGSQCVDFVLFYV